MPTYIGTINSNGIIARPMTTNIISNLPQFYLKQPTDTNYQYVDSYVSVLGECETQIQNTNDAMFVSTASGIDLDKIGEFHRLTRFPGESDTNFRERIRSFYPGFKGGGTRDSIVTNFWNRYAWVVQTVDYPAPNPMFKFKINVYPALLDLSSGKFVWSEVIDYLNYIKAAGVGHNDVFYTNIDATNGENVLLITDSTPTLTESPLMEIFYDDPINAYYDANGMYGWVVIYNGGFQYNNGWTYGGVYGYGYWDLGNWDAWNWGA